MKRMQGTSAFIERHYEAMPYWKQERKICYYEVKCKSTNPKSTEYNKECVGYTKCTEFISEEKYKQRQAYLYKVKMQLQTDTNEKNTDKKKIDYAIKKNNKFVSKKKKKATKKKEKAMIKKQREREAEEKLKIAAKIEKQNKLSQPKLSENALGNDPRFKELFKQFIDN